MGARTVVDGSEPTFMRRETQSMPNDTTVAVLGTGIMGAGMARNLLSAGMEVRAWNRTREKAEPLAEGSVKVADTPR
jgi:3-hydroxyisobutyrate dehydrogenase